MTNLPLSQQSRRSDSNSNDKGFGHDGIHINHVGFVLDDMDETVRRIHALGLRLEGNDATVDWPRSRSAYVMDPNGILIEITNRTRMRARIGRHFIMLPLRPYLSISL